MFYFPTEAERLIFECSCVPLPPKLLGFLVEHGLSVMILPPDEKRAKELCYGLLRIKEERLPVINKYPHENPHYDPARKTVVIPKWYLESSHYNVVLHELGHALDYLYYGDGHLLSNHPRVVEALRKVPPLDKHCLDQDTHWNSNCEQWASSFEAYFNEGVEDALGGGKEKKSEFYHTVNDIDLSFVDIMRISVITPFQDEADG